MKFDELKTALTQAQEQNNFGNFDLAEEIAQQVIARIPFGLSEHSALQSEEINQAGDQWGELYCSALLILAESARFKGDYKQALTHALSSHDLAEKHNYSIAGTNSHNILGIVYRNLGEYDKALEHYFKALVSNEAQHELSRVAIVMGNIGLVYWYSSSYDQALEYFHKALDAHQELGEKSVIAFLMGNIGMVYTKLGSYDTALEYYQNALVVYKEAGKVTDIARLLGNIGKVYQRLGTYDKALEYCYEALAYLGETGSKSLIASNMTSIGNVYLELGTYDKALEYFHNALAIHEELGEQSGVASIVLNIGNVYKELSSYNKAIEYYNKALAEYTELADKSGVALVLGNIGNVYKELGTYDKALEYYHKALAYHEDLKEKLDIARVTGNIGNLYAVKIYDGYDTAKAEEQLLRAIEMFTAIGAKMDLCLYYKDLSELYEDEERGIEALTYYKKYIEIEKEINIEEIKSQNEQREREKQIAITQATADAKLKATEELLHNVLPPSIADKMLGGTKLIAEKIQSVSVLFADIVNFTNLSQRITPEELVEGLDRIFSAFDALAEKYGLEKIKTIGDAYMVVSGAPVPRADHAEAMAHFAFDMVEAMKEFRSIATGEEVQIRIGIHSGEVVAGVIGKKKFAYDLWGDAVNTASRMESHGEPGKIHVSEEFMRALSPTSPMSPQFVERGEMDIKGKGKMKTYFLTKQ